MQRFSASNAEKQMACHGSADLETAIPFFKFPEADDVIRASDVGTEAHEVFEKLMHYSARDMLAWIRVLEYVAYLRSTRRFKVLTEHKFTAEWLDVDATGNKPVTTADLVLYTKDELHVLDLKWGRIPVDAHKNVQTMYYGAAAAPLSPKAEGVTVHILQPRAKDDLGEWNLEPYYVSATELAHFMGETLTHQRAINAGDLSLGVGDHCKFCPAYPQARIPKGRPMCPAAMQVLYPAPFDEDAILND